jgi:hypothetical protein
MLKQIHIWLILPVLLFLISCEREFEFEHTGWEAPVVLNGILEADSLPVTVFLYHAQEMGDTSTILPIEGVKMWLESGNDKYAFEYTDSGRYICNIAPQPSKTYCVNALVDGDTVWAKTTIPSGRGLGKVTRDTLETSPRFAGAWYYYKMSINDLKDENSTYWFWVYEIRNIRKLWGDSIINRGLIYDLIRIHTKSPYADKFMVTNDPGALFGYTLDYGSFLRVPDNGFDGGQVIVDVYYSNLSSGNNGKFCMAEFDEHYDKYMKTYLSHADYLSMMDELTIFYQPSFIYSNVHNGTGIFGSMAVKDTIISDNPLFQNYQYD